MEVEETATVARLSAIAGLEEAMDAISVAVSSVILDFE